jgi:hypothetical protein
MLPIEPPGQGFGMVSLMLRRNPLEKVQVLTVSIWILRLTRPQDDELVASVAGKLIQLLESSLLPEWPAPRWIKAVDLYRSKRDEALSDVPRR